MIKENNKLHCLVCGKEFISLGNRYRDEDGRIITPGKYFHDIQCLDGVYEEERDCILHPERRHRMELHCVMCGKPFMAEFGDKGWTDGQKFCSVECGERFLKEIEPLDFEEFVKLCPPDTEYRIYMDGGKIINKKFRGRNFKHLPLLEKIKKYGVRNVHLTKSGVVTFDIHSPA